MEWPFAELQLVEFDTLMQYYCKLNDQMSLINGDKLSLWFTDAGIIMYDYETLIECDFISKIHIPDIILISLASHLLSGENTFFYDMLDILQNHADGSHDLVAEINIVLDQKLSTGM